jgi:hypothetical protein
MGLGSRRAAGGGGLITRLPSIGVAPERSTKKERVGEFAGGFIDACVGVNGDLPSGEREGGPLSPERLPPVGEDHEPTLLAEPEGPPSATRSPVTIMSCMLCRMRRSSRDGSTVAHVVVCGLAPPAGSVAFATGSHRLPHDGRTDPTATFVPPCGWLCNIAFFPHFVFSFFSNTENTNMSTMPSSSRPADADGAPRIPKLDLKQPPPRSASAGRVRRSASASTEAQVTPRKKKESRQLRTELRHSITGVRKMESRVRQALSIVQGTMKMLQATSDDSHRRLEQNPKMVKRASSAPDFTPPALTSGQLKAEVAWSTGTPERGVVGAVTNLANSSDTSFKVLSSHEAEMLRTIDVLGETAAGLSELHAVHDASIEELAKCKTTPPLVSPPGSFQRGKWSFGANDALALAENHVDCARISMMKCLGACQNARSALGAKKCAVQVAVRDARSKTHAQWVSGRFGKFGSTGERDTDPATRRLVHTPESMPEHQWPARPQGAI